MMQHEKSHSTFNLSSAQCSADKALVIYNPALGRLEFNFEKILSYPCYVCVNNWHQGLQVWSDVEADSSSEYSREEFDLLEDGGVSGLLESHDPEIAKWWATFPEDILGRLQAFPGYRFLLARLCFQFNEAKDLLAHNPLLLFLFFKQVLEQKASTVRIQNLLTKKQIDILKFCDLPGTPATVKLLRKMKFVAPNQKELVILKEILTRDNAFLKRMSHEAEFSFDKLQMLKTYPWMLGNPILVLCDQQINIRRLKMLLGDSERMCRRLGLNFEKRFELCVDLQSVELAHDKLLPEFNKLLQSGEYSLLPFPKPPHAGTDLILPITSVAGIIHEANRMRHCIASYLDDIFSGKYYVYHLDLNVPLTIGVKLKKGRIFQLDQIQGVANSEPSSSAQSLVEEWFSQFLNAPADD